MPTDSVLDAQAELVRTRVLEGVARLLGDGEELTFTRVAAAAGVSERTVYRHFANREALMAAVYAWANDRIGFAGTPPVTAAEMVDMVRQVFPGFDTVAPVVDELLTSADGRRARLAEVDARRRAALAVVADGAPELDATAQRHVAAVVQVLGTAAVWQALRDFWDMDGAEAGDAVATVVDLLLTPAPKGAPQ
jgi:AcrR family transcriptional regulator